MVQMKDMEYNSINFKNNDWESSLLIDPEEIRNSHSKYHFNFIKNVGSTIAEDENHY